MDSVRFRFSFSVSIAPGNLVARPQEKTRRRLPGGFSKKGVGIAFVLQNPLVRPCCIARTTSITAATIPAASFGTTMELTRFMFISDGRTVRSPRGGVNAGFVGINLAVGLSQARMARRHSRELPRGIHHRSAQLPHVGEPRAESLAETVAVVRDGITYRSAATGRPKGAAKTHHGKARTTTTFGSC
jgi:hypothetical protein